MLISPKSSQSAGYGKTPTITSTTYTTTVNGKQRQRRGHQRWRRPPYYGLPPLSNDSAIFVVPNGLNVGWGNLGGEDVTFFDTMVKTIEADLCVDTNLRFSTGFSYGGAMSYSLACSHASMLRGVAVLSGAPLSGCAGGSDPVAYYGQHGTSDSVLNVAMGRGLRDKFVQNNGCTPLSPEPQPNSSKSTDNNSGQPFAPGNTWEFFSQFS
ncbi:Alpha/Beta hydrolase protein [Hypoxylon sp. FL1284]|nr:Alpha/Beta hydrolase protein [Hypoxylon sp. FL1284]